MKRGALAVLFASVALAACTTTAAAPAPVMLQPTASNGHDLTRLNIKANSMLESRQPAGEVTIQPSERFTGYGSAFVVAVKNISPAAQDFGPASISATVHGKPLAMLTPADLQTAIQGRARMQMQTKTRGPQDTRDIEAAYYTANQDHRFNNFGGCKAGDGACRAFSDDVGAGYREDERNRDLNLQTSQEVAAGYMRDMADLKVALGPGQIPAGQVGGGVIVFERPPTGQTVDVTVTFAGQPHTFTYKAVPAA